MSGAIKSCVWCGHPKHGIGACSECPCDSGDGRAPAEHPAPGRWNGYVASDSEDVGESLLDANGAVVLTANCDCEPKGRARALIEAAPQLADALTWALETLARGDGADAETFVRANALLARLDKDGA